MGTRNLTMVVLNGETKVAQYGQWDGYPSGQGKTALEFLHKVDIEKFKKQVGKLKWLSDAEVGMVNKNDNWQNDYPYLSRDAGAKILQYVYENKTTTGLKNSENFAGDSLFCEWAYVIDLDKNTFEIYRGYNKTPLTKKERFAKTEHEGGYHPVKHKKTYSLSELPTIEQFKKDFKKEW